MSTRRVNTLKITIKDHQYRYMIKLQLVLAPQSTKKYIQFRKYLPRMLITVS
jgi:hypothetical protein